MGKVVNKWVRSVIDHPQRSALLIMTHPGIEAIGSTVKDAVTDGRVHFMAIDKVSKEFSTMACTVIMDLTVEAEAFGSDIVMPENEIPTVTGRLVYDADSVNALEIPTLDSARVPQYLLASRLAVEHSSKPVFSGCIGPFSLAGRLYGMSEIMMGIYIETDVILTLLDKCTEFILSYCKALKKAGASGVIIAEPASGLLSDDDCKNFSSVYVSKIVQEVQDEDFAVILHNCGNSGQCTDAMISTGAAALHFGNSVNILEVLMKCPDNILVMGNLDPVGLFKQASAQEVYSQTMSLLANTAGYRNFVISSGCDMPTGVPEENIRAFFSALTDYNRRNSDTEPVLLQI